MRRHVVGVRAGHAVLQCGHVGAVVLTRLHGVEDCRACEPQRQRPMEDLLAGYAVYESPSSDDRNLTGQTRADFSDQRSRRG